MKGYEHGDRVIYRNHGSQFNGWHAVVSDPRMGHSDEVQVRFDDFERYASAHDGHTLPIFQLEQEPLSDDDLKAAIASIQEASRGQV